MLRKLWRSTLILGRFSDLKTTLARAVIYPDLDRVKMALYKRSAVRSAGGEYRD